MKDGGLHFRSILNAFNRKINGFLGPSCNTKFINLFNKYLDMWRKRNQEFWDLKYTNRLKSINVGFAGLLNVDNYWTQGDFGALKSPQGTTYSQCSRSCKIQVRRKRVWKWVKRYYFGSIGDQQRNQRNYIFEN